jgi:ABC-type multidrug transport system ATPase subunit
VTGAEPALVAADGLEVRYHGGPDPAVRGVSLRLGPGEGLLVSGPAGAGKTSLLRGLLDLVPRAGEVRLPDRVGYGPQAGGFATGLRVDEAVAMVAAVRGAGSPRATAAEALERAGLQFVTRWRTRRLDPEGWRRLSLALAIAGDPPLVVLDDPWVLREVLQEIVRARARGAAVIAASPRPAGLGPALGGRLDMAGGAPR